jgi:hypothetical protein
METSYCKKLHTSDQKFLSRSVFVTDGDLVGFTTMREVFAYGNRWYFSSNFIMGKDTYKFINGYVEREFCNPIDIFDAHSGKLVSAKGALQVFSRVRGVGSDLNRFYRGHRGGRRCSMRNPQTLSALRAFSYRDVDDGEPLYTGRQTTFRVTARDDLWRENQKSWKKNRDHQYKS